ncbi:arginine deiminase-related protein [Dolichospermum sp. ST_sed1]|nr:arginine deiminase-related protein [Dolichospermum sp. ST_sed1]
MLNTELLSETNYKILNSPLFAKPKGVFFVKPTYFDIITALNVHTLDKNGQINSIDKNKADQQWQTLVNTYKSIGQEISFVEGKKDAQDMVFCANQSFPFLDKDGRKHAILSNMRHPSRQVEVVDIGSALENFGYQIHTLPPHSEIGAFEGMGDALWVLGRKVILAGYGFRTDVKVYDILKEKVDADLILFELKNPKFYHLDTCLSVLNDTTVLACKAGYTDKGWKALKGMFTNVIEVSDMESDAPFFACNAHCPDGKHVIIQQGCTETEKQLTQAGFKVLAIDTSEYIKSGGSVFCMKQILF